MLEANRLGAATFSFARERLIREYWGVLLVKKVVRGREGRSMGYIICTKKVVEKEVEVERKRRLAEIDGVFLANLLAEFVERKDSNSHRQRHKREQGVAPSVAHGLVHGRSGERKEGADDGAGSGERSQSTRRILGESIDHVRLHGDENAHHTDTEGHHSDNGDNPVGVLLGGPTVPDERCREPHSPECAIGKSHLGFRDTTVAFGEFEDVAVRNLGLDRDADEEPDAHAEVSKTGDFGGEAVLLGEDGGEGGEHQVENSVDGGQVRAHERRDR